ncbi:O-antigen ligase family protein [Thermopolyspora sp. NPDC052614]|uniref:O-antigen ligase family protein n=1 Tax=Thermopolyspora sp. NPDC052614 TaxID=3155682 RepID=UPI00344811CE
MTAASSPGRTRSAGRTRAGGEAVAGVVRRRADGATVACLFAVVLLIVPARLVFRYLPLSLTPANVISLIAALCWLFAQFTTTLGMAKGRNPVRTALFAHITATIATYGVATYGYLPSDELNLADHALVLIVAVVGLALLVCDGVRDANRLDFLLKCVVTAGAIVAVIGGFQFVLDLDLTRFLRLPILEYTSADAFVLERSDLRRVAATTGHPIEFGVVCAMLLPIAAHYGFQARERAEPALRWWACTALIAMGLMFSVSRSAMLGLVGVGVVLLLGWPARRRLQAIAVTGGFLVAVWLLVPGLLSTFYGLFANLGADDSIRYRTHDYAVAADQIARHPWLGRGLATWYAPKHQVFDNQYILSAVETGLIGVIVIVAMFLTAAYAALRARHLSADPATRDLGLSLAAALTVPLIGMATFDLFSFATVTGVTFLLIGASGALLRAVHGPGQVAQGRGPTVEVMR